MRKVFNNKKSKKLERGIAFPTCISMNNICGHYSPLVDETQEMKEGDVAKIDLGCHIDGFSAVAAHTVVVSADGASKVASKAASTIMAAHTAMQAAIRTIKEMATNNEITEVIAKVCEQFGVNPLEGVLSHKIKRHLLDGNDAVINKETPDQRVEEFEFAPGDVIGLDIIVTSGEGKPKESEFRTTVYKRELDTQYSLKSKSARSFFGEVNKRFPTLPFCIRAFEEQTGAKVGVKECLNHDLLGPYPVLNEKIGEIVAQFKTTIAVLPKSTQVLAGDIPVTVARYEPEKKVEDAELKDLLAKDLWKKEEKKEKKKVEEKKKA